MELKQMIEAYVKITDDWNASYYLYKHERTKEHKQRAEGLFNKSLELGKKIYQELTTFIPKMGNAKRDVLDGLMELLVTKDSSRIAPDEFITVAKLLGFRVEI